MEAYFSSEEEYVDVIHPRTRSLCTMNDEKRRMECMLECIRKKEFPELHSRLSCTFVAPNYVLAKKWFQTQHSHPQDVREIQYYIYKVCVPDDTLWFNADYLTTWNVLHGNPLRLYWESCQSGPIESSETLYEGIIIGDVRITTKYSETFYVPERFAHTYNIKILTPFTEPENE